MTSESDQSLYSPIDPESLRPDPEAGRRLTLFLAAPLIVVGVLLSAASLFEDTYRFSFSYLLGFCFLWSIVVGGMFLLATHYITGAVWSVVFRRVMETLVFSAPLVALLFLPVLAGSKWIYLWTDSELVAGDSLLFGKRHYLNLPFFAARAILFFAIWIGFGQRFVRRSLTQDDGVNSKKSPGAGSALFLILFALTVTFASFDWLMSLEPRWYSTIFGVYVFSGMTLSALAAVTLLALWLRRAGMFGPVELRADHFYSLGALMFVFTCFWAYIAVSQFLLIWYSNLPEETFWYVYRWNGNWKWLSLGLAAARFLIPFFALLSRSAKMNPARLALVAAFILFGQVLDLYWLIMPAAPANAAPCGWSDFGPLIFMTGLAVAVTGRFVSRSRAVAIGDPKLGASRAFHL